MAQFCGRCGAPLSGTFCGSCGAPANQPGTPAQASSPASAPFSPAPPPPAAGGSPILKIVLVVLGVFALIAMVAIGGIVYTGYKIKQKVEQTAKEQGVDLGDLAKKLGSAASSGEAAARDGCPLLPKEEVEELTGLAITRVDGTPGSGDDREHCDYFGNAAEAAERGQKQVQDALKSLQAGKGDKDVAAGLAEIKKITQGLGSNVPASQGAGEARLLRLMVKRGEAQSQLMALKMAIGAIGTQNIPGAGLTKVEGLGDEAYLTPMDQILVIRRGQDFVQLEIGSIPESKEKGIELARRVLARL